MRVSIKPHVHMRVQFETEPNAHNVAKLRYKRTQFDMLVTVCVGTYSKKYTFSYRPWIKRQSLQEELDKAPMLQNSQKAFPTAPRMETGKPIRRWIKIMIQKKMVCFIKAIILGSCSV